MSQRIPARSGELLGLGKAYLADLGVMQFAVDLANDKNAVPSPLNMYGMSRTLEMHGAQAVLAAQDEALRPVAERFINLVISEGVK